MTSASDLKARQFEALISSIPDGETGVRRWRDVALQLLERDGSWYVFLTVMCASILLLLRPPFVLHFELDERKPWKSHLRISWLSVASVTAIVVCLAAIIPYLCPI